MTEDIRELIEQGIREVNRTRENPIPIDRLDVIQLYGEGGVFDSMQLVNFLLLLEEKVEDALNVAVSLTSERAISRKVSPFRSVVDLTAFIVEEISGSESCSHSAQVA